MGAKIPTAKSNNGNHIQKREGCIVHRFEMKCVSYWCKPQLIPQNKASSEKEARRDASNKINRISLPLLHWIICNIYPVTI